MLGRTSLYRERQQRVTFLIKVRIVPKQELCNFFFNTRMFHHVYHGPTALYRSSQHEKTPVTRDTVTAPSTLMHSSLRKTTMHKVGCGGFALQVCMDGSQGLQMGFTS